uniref:Uncharacterized protein n=1 Tax=Strongyloides venezuelensis TaxID=75913 RepID=A0A0K0FEV5_STRVS
MAFGSPSPFSLFNSTSLPSSSLSSEWGKKNIIIEGIRRAIPIITKPNHHLPIHIGSLTPIPGGTSER